MGRLLPFWSNERLPTLRGFQRHSRQSSENRAAFSPRFTLTDNFEDASGMRRRWLRCIVRWRKRRGLRPSRTRVSRR